MDAHVYFAITDRIQEAATPQTLESLRAEIVGVNAHDFERRALIKLVERRQTLLDRHVIVAEA